MDKMNEGPVTAAEETRVDVIESLTDLYTKGIEQLAEVQKNGLEIAVKHNSEVADAWRKFTLPAPGTLMLDLSTTAFERFAETQKGAIDLIVEQTRTFSKLVKERKVKATETMGEGQKRAKEAIEHSIAAQKTALDYTAKQTKAVFETAKQQLGYADTPVGRNPTQIDYADYREVDGVKTPFRWTLSRPNGRFTIQIKEAKANVPVEDSQFTKK